APRSHRSVCDPVWLPSYPDSVGLLRTRGAAQLLVEDGAERFDVVRRRRRMPRGIPRDPTEIASPGRRRIDLTGDGADGSDGHGSTVRPPAALRPLLTQTSCSAA